MARKKLAGYVVKVRETRLIDYVVDATDKADALARVESGEGEPFPEGSERIDWKPEHAERND